MTTISLAIPRPTHPTGIWSWITTIDHKRIGILYGVTAFVMLMLGGVEALMMRTQLASSEQDIVSPEVYNQLFTMHGTTMIFLGVFPPRCFRTFSCSTASRSTCSSGASTSTSNRARTLPLTWTGIWTV